MADPPVEGSISQDRGGFSTLYDFSTKREPQFPPVRDIYIKHVVCYYIVVTANNLKPDKARKPGVQTENNPGTRWCCSVSSVPLPEPERSISCIRAGIDHSGVSEGLSASSRAATCRRNMLRVRAAVSQVRRGFRMFPCAAVEVKNEPILGFMEGSAERKELLKALDSLKGRTEEIPCVVGDERVWTKDIRYQLSPFNHSHKVAKFCYADKELINKAILASVSARKEWDLKPVQDRAQILFKAADVISGPKRAEILAKTMIGQGKTVIQAEIDAAAELIDFFRFNAKHAIELEKQQPLNAEGSTNTMLYRGLEGFVAAVAPFNFTAIGGNLAGTPALMGNVVLWKPSDTAMSASYAVYNVLRDCGLPPNIIQFLPADGPVFGDTVTSSQHLAGINFTGSVPTFKRLWKQVAQNLDTYRTFPRLAGECGGKNFHFVHKSADIESVVKGTIRSAFEYGGQKCSACSRMYVPDSIWPQIKQQLLDIHRHITVGDPVEDFSTFFSAVIDDKSFARIKRWLDRTKSSPSLRVIAGGHCDDTKGYFVEPTIIETTDPQDAIMNEEIFGPVLSVYVYPENEYKEVLQLIDNTSPYALTGAVYAQDKKVVEEAAKALRNAAGNYYVNDKSTGSIVAQQPFGGARASGTNDKPGGRHYVLRWTSPQVVKETQVPLTDWRLC
uniref:Multifunctional fusion protein n=1 Tax=Dicentrarchus labrax TaxID=13489 RepID=A0A8P4GDW2_DICLA